MAVCTTKQYLERTHTKASISATTAIEEILMTVIEGTLITVTKGIVLAVTKKTAATAIEETVAIGTVGIIAVGTVGMTIVGSTMVVMRAASEMIRFHTGVKHISQSGSERASVWFIFFLCQSYSYYSHLSI